MPRSGTGTIPSLRLIMEFFYGHSLPDSRRGVVSYLRKNVHCVLANRLVDINLSSVVRLTDRPAMTISVDRGR